MRTFLFLVALLSGSPAALACFNDVDCTANGTACGTDVCEWTRGMTCLPANEPLDGGLLPTGWCSNPSHCKCAGATCVASHCQYILPLDMAGWDFSPSPDLKQPADMLASTADLDGADLTQLPDLAAPPDLIGVVQDLSASVPNDLVSATDLGGQDQGASSCDHDTECPGSECGGQVCRWSTTQTCVPAGTDIQGQDGWCNKDDECKCKAQGATCDLTTLHCTFTKPPTKKSGGCSAAGDASGAPAALALVILAVFLSRRTSASIVS